MKMLMKQKATLQNKRTEKKNPHIWLGLEIQLTVKVFTDGM
jgi:hypothetical protein